MEQSLSKGERAGAKAFWWEESDTLKNDKEIKQTETSLGISSTNYLIQGVKRLKKKTNTRTERQVREAALGFKFNTNFQGFRKFQETLELSTVI